MPQLDRAFATLRGRATAIAFVLGIAASAVRPAAAQDPAARGGTSEGARGASIVVTGRGLPESPATPAYDVAIVDRDRLIEAASGRIEDALADVAGFQQFRRSDSRSSNPSAQGVTLRALGGNATSRALVLLDGVPQADPFFGYIPFSALAPERLASARVTRGGGAGPFGAGALAGTIELTSAGPATLGPASGRLLIDDRAETEASAVFAPQLGAGFAVLAGRWDRGRGFFTTPPDQRVPATARARYDQWSVQARGVAPIAGQMELQATGRIYDDRRTLRFDGADSKTAGQDASVRLVGRGDWAFDVLGYVQARDFANVVVSSTRFVPVLNQARTPSTGIGGKAELRPPVGAAHVLRLGADYRRASGMLLEEALSQVTGAVTARRRAGGVNTDVGLFVEDDWTLGPLILTAGIRADRTTIRDGVFEERDGTGRIVTAETYADSAAWLGSVRGGAVYALTARLRLRAAGYTGLRQPTLNELYRPFVVFPVTTQANADLGNERLVGFEAGGDWRPVDGVELRLTAFDNRLRDAIANVTIATNLRQRRNIDAIHARGIEAGIGATRGAFRFDGSLAYTDAEAQGTGAAAALDGNRPAQTPRLAASATLAFAPAANARLALTLRHTGAQFEDDLETDVLLAATTLDAYAALPLTRALGLVVRGENLFDERIVTRNQGGSVDLGVPRTVWAGIRYGF